PVGGVDPELLAAWRMGAYQLGWLDRVPARAAIHESVELVKRVRKRSAAPFVNAVLRKLMDSSLSLGARQELIVSASDADAVATVSAHPSWLVRRWVSQYGRDWGRHRCLW